MAFRVTQLAVMVAAASMLTVSMANWSWGPEHGDSHDKTNSTNKIIVGGSEHWRFGFNYSDWAWKTGPFYKNDVLVFKYDAPNSTVFPHNVYLLPNLWSYLQCDFSKAKMIANNTQGGGEGFEFKLKKWLHPYYFACGERNGSHCRDGNMKFIALPLLHH